MAGPSFSVRPFLFVLISAVSVAAAPKPVPLSLAGFPARNAEDAAKSPVALLDYLARGLDEPSGELLRTRRDELRARLAVQLASAGQAKEAWAIFRNGLRGMGLKQEGFGEPYSLEFAPTKQEDPFASLREQLGFIVIQRITYTEAFQNDLKFQQQAWREMGEYIGQQKEKEARAMWLQLSSVLRGKKMLKLSLAAAERAGSIPKRQQQIAGFPMFWQKSAKADAALRACRALVNLGKGKEHGKAVIARFDALEKKVQQEIIFDLSNLLANAELPEATLHVILAHAEPERAASLLLWRVGTFHFQKNLPLARRAMAEARQLMEDLGQQAGDGLWAEYAGKAIGLGDLALAEKVAGELADATGTWFLLAEAYQKKKDAAKAGRFLKLASEKAGTIRRLKKAARLWEALGDAEQADATRHRAAALVREPKFKLDRDAFREAWELVEELHQAKNAEAAGQLREGLIARVAAMKDEHQWIAALPFIIDSLLRHGHAKEAARRVEQLMDLHWALVDEKLEGVKKAGFSSGYRSYGKMPRLKRPAPRFRENGSMSTLEHNGLESYGLFFSRTIKHHHWPGGYTRRNHWWSAANSNQLRRLVQVGILSLDTDNLPRLRKLLPHMKNHTHRTWLITAAILENADTPNSRGLLKLDNKRLKLLASWVALLPDPKHRAHVADVLQFWHLENHAESWTTPYSFEKAMANAGKIEDAELRARAFDEATHKLLQNYVPGEPGSLRQSHDALKAALAATRKIKAPAARVFQLHRLAISAYESGATKTGREILADLQKHIPQLPAADRPRAWARTVALAARLQEAAPLRAALRQIKPPALRRAALIAAACELSFRWEIHKFTLDQWRLKPAFDAAETKITLLILAQWKR